MKLYKETIQLESKGKKTSYFNITPEVNKIIKNSGIQDGLCFVISPHTTCSVFFEEFVHDYTEEGDEYLQADLNDVLRKIIPDHVSADTYRYPGEKHYEEVFSWPEEKIRSFLPNMKREELFNGDAHLKATLLGTDVTLDVADGRLGVGVTGYVYFADFDCTHSRKRTCKVAVLG